jgi:hypothetical protein
VNFTVDPAIVQTELVEASIENVTAFPEPPPVALTLYVVPTNAGFGADDVNPID